MKTIRVIISGEVQGVGFRFWTRRRFEELGLVGDAWNNPDETVGAEFSGEPEAVEEMIKLLHRGPMLAKVKKVMIE